MRRTIAFVPVDISTLDLQFRSSEGFGSQIGGNQNLFPLLADFNALEALDLVKEQGHFFELDPVYNSVQEETFSAFVAFDFIGDFNDIPYTLNVGVRWEDTDVKAVSLQREITALNYVNTAGRFSEVFTPDVNSVSLEGGYTRLLPNVDFSLELTDEIMARFSYSSTLSRPDISSLFPSTTIDARPTGPYNASVGNPNLKPLDSQNIDLSLEWYYDEGSYISAGYFIKYVENFIGVTTREGTMPDVNGNPLTDPSINPRPGCPDEVVGGNPACFSTQDDPAINFQIATPGNLDDAQIDGWELNLQHMFGESGFGVVANYTAVDGDVVYDVYDVNNTFALTGLSDSANLIGFYEKNGLQIRLAYNWRDDFLLALYQPQRAGEPTFVEEYGQWDINASYEVSEAVSVFVEGINITEEVTRQHGRFKDQLLSYDQYGARYNVGVTVKF
jgi:TonB-dependent receptor